MALCAGCNAMASWAAVVVGAVSGPLFLFGQFALTKLRCRRFSGRAEVLLRSKIGLV